MKMYILIENKPEGMYTASLIGWPGITSQGSTEDEAIGILRSMLATRLQDARIVSLETDAAHPWMQTAGMFQDDPFADELDACIAAYRRELDAEEHAADIQDHAA